MPLGRIEAKMRRDKIRRWLLTGWICVFTALTCLALIGNRRQSEDTQRLAEQNRMLALQARELALQTRTLVLQFRQLTLEGQQAHDSLCTLRVDLQRRADDSAKFLADIKAKRRPPIPGITVVDLQRLVNGQRATLDSLQGLKC
jgi:hypothetical protein